MAIIKTPQQQVDTALSSIASAESLKTIIDAVSNPNWMNDMRKVGKDLVDANTLAAQKREEAKQAAKIIEDAKVAAEQIEKKRKEHDEYISSTLNDLGEKQEDLSDAIAEFEKNKIESKKANDDQLSLIQKSRTEAENRHKEADKRETDIAVNQSALDKLSKQRDSEYASKMAEVNDMQTALTKELNKVAARKKKMLDAAKDD